MDDIGFLQEIKAVVKSLVLSSPHDMTIQELDKDFRASEGYPIPYGKLGFRNLETFLLSIGDTVQVHGHGTMATLSSLGNGKSDHIREMIQGQKKTPRRTRVNGPAVKTPTNGYADGQRNKLNVPYDRNLNFRHNQTRNNQTPRRYDIQCHVLSREKDVKRKPMQNIYKPPTVRPALSKPLEWTQMTKSVEQTQTAKSVEQTQTTKSVEQTRNKKRLLPVEVIEEELLRTVNGLQINEGNEQQPNIQKYWDKSKKLNKIQSTDLIEIAKNRKSNIFEISDPDKELFDDLEEAVPQFAANSLVYRLDFPENTVVFGQRIDSYTLTDNLKKGSVIGIFISEIHNPYKFWFNIYKENHELDVLMYNMERFYRSLDNNDFVLPISCHVPTQICAALYNNLWHRGEIINFPKSNATKVFFVDYGTVFEVRSQNIKYLVSVFATLPSQALRGSLSHIKPRGLHWSHEASQYFLSLVTDTMLYAQITEVDEEDRVLHMVCISNTNDSDIIQINKMLIEEKFAFYDENWNEARIKKNGMRWHHPREDFPTFEMIERGEYPSLSEIIDLYNDGINYEKIIDGKVFHRGKLNNHENAPEPLRNLPFPLLNNNPFKYDIIWEMHNANNNQ